jgi:hypothetical protein
MALFKSVRKKIIPITNVLHIKNKGNYLRYFKSDIWRHILSQILI